MIPTSSAGAARAVYIPAPENDPLRARPEGMGTIAFLILIGSQTSPSEADHSSRPETPELEESHPSVSFEQDEDGNDKWIMRHKTPAVGKHASEEDEIMAFGMTMLMERGRVTNTGRHDDRGWILWKFSANPAKAAEKDVLFTMGGPRTGKSGEYIDEETQLLVCCDDDHASIASGEMSSWASCRSYGYEIPDSIRGKEEERGEVDSDSDSDSDDEAEGARAEDSGSDDGRPDRGILASPPASPSPPPSPSALAPPDRTPQEISQEYPDIGRACELGDIEATSRHHEGHPIWRIHTSADYRGGDILFTTGDVEELQGSSLPPHVSHVANQVHSSLEMACWGWWSSEQGGRVTEEEYQCLIRGIRERYTPRT